MGHSRLSNTGLKEQLRELAQFGSPVDLAGSVREVEHQKVEIHQVGGICDSRVFELEDGRVAIIADILVTNMSSRPIPILDVVLPTSWGASSWYWLTPRQFQCQGPRKRDCNFHLYRFPGKCGWELPYDQVINHHLFERRKLPANRQLEGWLLGVGGAFPAELRDRQRLTMQLSIIGSDHTEYTETIQLLTERLEVRKEIKKPRTKLMARKEDTILRRDAARSAVQSAGSNGVSISR